MEKIYEVSGFRASERINFNQYFKKYSDICPAPLNNVHDNLVEFIGEGPLSNFNDLETLCNPNSLTLSNEPPNVPIDMPDKMHSKTKFDHYYPITPKARELNVVQAKEGLDKKRDSTEITFPSKRTFKSSIENDSLDYESNPVKPYSDYILSILIYQPRSIEQGNKYSSEKLRFAYEIEAIGSNKLSEVVDIIDCASNLAIIKEVENTDADLSEFQNAKKWYPAQTVFIDGVFYNDTRVPNSTDLSKEVIKWAKEKDIGVFTTAKMEETLLSSLSPRLGYPYVYIHQGNCEHIFSFSDARLVLKRDNIRSNYPRIVSSNRESNILCFLCAKRPSEWMVFRCEKFPQERTFLCTKCCDLYLYIDGEKVTDFKLYPYYN
ncbi:unnamed protein product [Phyllotreta striolata]|uniref:snRNA-activating protein complex subunit 3 n=1 Tax=Phyllotreta striolata TaxID=444603 RepID=A0A9N9TV45_PHYSR|nr:unnamed protein product [Phyllotreta striolata]